MLLSGIAKEARRAVASPTGAKVESVLALIWPKVIHALNYFWPRPFAPSVLDVRFRHPYCHVSLKELTLFHYLEFSCNADWRQNSCFFIHNTHVPAPKYFVAERIFVTLSSSDIALFEGIDCPNWRKKDQCRESKAIAMKNQAWFKI